MTRRTPAFDVEKWAAIITLAAALVGMGVAYGRLQQRVDDLYADHDRHHPGEVIAHSKE